MGKVHTCNNPISFSMWRHIRVVNGFIGFVSIRIAKCLVHSMKYILFSMFSDVGWGHWIQLMYKEIHFKTWLSHLSHCKVKSRLVFNNYFNEDKRDNFPQISVHSIRPRVWLVPHENCINTCKVMHAKLAVFIDSVSNWATANTNCIEIQIYNCENLLTLSIEPNIDRLHTNTVNISLFNPFILLFAHLLSYSRSLWQICRSVCKYFFSPLWKYWLRFTTLHNLSVYMFIRSIAVAMAVAVALDVKCK